MLFIAISSLAGFASEKFTWSKTQNSSLEVGARAQTIKTWNTSMLLIQYAYKNVSKEVCSVPVSFADANIWVLGMGCQLSMFPRERVEGGSDPDPFLADESSLYTLTPSRISAQIQNASDPLMVFPLEPGEVLKFSPFSTSVGDSSSLRRIDISMGFGGTADPFAEAGNFQKHIARREVIKVFKTKDQVYGEDRWPEINDQPINRGHIIRPFWNTSLTLKFGDLQKDGTDDPKLGPEPSSDRVSKPKN